jgi:hypothetical protein
MVPLVSTVTEHRFVPAIVGVTAISEHSWKSRIPDHSRVRESNELGPPVFRYTAMQDSVSERRQCPHPKRLQDRDHLREHISGGVVVRSGERPDPVRERGQDRRRAADEEAQHAEALRRLLIVPS